MSDVFLLSERQMEQITPFFPLAHRVPSVDDRRVLSGIVYGIRKGLPWKDAPKAYAPPKTLYNPLSGGAAWASLTGYLSR